MFATEEKMSILMAIVKKQNLWKLIDNLKEKINSSQFLVLKSSVQQYQNLFFVIYQGNIQKIDDKYLKFTIVHKKGRCYYTINALNALVEEKNDGVMSKDFVIDWEQYQNMILFLNKQKKLVCLDTKLYKIIKN